MTESGYPFLKNRSPTTEREIREAHEAVEVCPALAISFGEAGVETQPEAG